MRSKSTTAKCNKSFPTSAASKKLLSRRSPPELQDPAGHAGRAETPSVSAALRCARQRRPDSLAALLKCSRQTAKVAGRGVAHGESQDEGWGHKFSACAPPKTRVTLRSSSRVGPTPTPTCPAGQGGRECRCGLRQDLAATKRQHHAAASAFPDRKAFLCLSAADSFRSACHRPSAGL